MISGIVAPTGLLSTATYVALAPVNMLRSESIAYTIKVATQDVKWTVYGANAADYSDEVVVQAEATVAAAAASSYAVAVAPYAYYRVKIKDAAGGVHGTATVVGIFKRRT